MYQINHLALFLKAIIVSLIAFIFFASYYNQCNYIHFFFLLLACSYSVVLIYKLTKISYLSIYYILPIFVFTLIYLISGIIHILPLDKLEFYSLTNYNKFSILNFTLILVLFAFVSLISGFTSHIYTDFKFTKLNIAVFTRNISVIFIIIGIFSLLKLFGQNIDQLFLINRGMDTSGFGKYVFMSSWASIGLSYFIGYYLSRGYFLNSLSFILIMILFCSFSLTFVFWTGGRATSIITLLPSFLVFYRYRPLLIKRFGLFALIFVLYYITYSTVSRWKDGTSNTIDGNTLLLSIFDWQMGRFSIVGISIESVNLLGFGMGKTFFRSILESLQLIPIALHISPFEIGLSTNNIVGDYLGSGINYEGFVAGGVADVYYNFGLIGVILLFYSLGSFYKFIIFKLVRASNIETFLFYCYLLSHVCFSAISGVFFGWIYSVFTIGLPAVIIYLFQFIYYKKNGHKSYFS